MVRKIVLVLFVAIVAVAVIKRDRIMAMFETVERTENGTEVKLIFGEDPSFDELVHAFVEKGVLSSDTKFRKYVNENELDTTNFAGGKFIVLSGTTYGQLIDGFQKGEDGRGKSEQLVKVIFNNCMNTNEMSGHISKCIVADSSTLAEYINSPETLQKYGFTQQQMPALFLPKQYEMEYDTDAEEFVAFMANEFKTFWNAERMAKLKAIGLSKQSQAATLASIVYSEQGRVKDEWPVIARLYLNRLDRGQMLQSDPTFKFCWGHELDNVQRLLNKHREIDCEYNTYKINGLPPGPICITPASVIDAVLNAEDNDYIYMCAKPDFSGEHNFTASLSEHNRNASAYRKWLKKQGK